MKKSNIAIIIGILCMLLTIGIFVQAKTIEDAKKTVGVSIVDNSKLKDEVLKWKEKYDNAYRELEDAEEFLEISRKRATENDSESIELESELTKSNRFLGLTEITGTGVTVTLDDNREITPETAGILSVSDYLIHDGDIIEVVNELKNAGAEGISINDQRVVHTTGILCDGNVVRINGKKIGTPFVIKAIGFPESLYYALEKPGGYMQLLRTYGIVAKVEKNDEVTLPKYDGIYTYEHIK